MTRQKMLKDCALAAILLAATALSLSARGFAQDVDPADLVKDIHAIFGDHHARAVHAKGIVLEATFEPTGEDARQLSKAIVFAGKSAGDCAPLRHHRHTGNSRTPIQLASPHGHGDQVQPERRQRDGLVTHSFNGFPAATAMISTSFCRLSRRAAREQRSPRRSSNTLQAHPERVAFRHKAESAAGKLCDDHLFRCQRLCLHRCVRQEDRGALSICAAGGRKISRRGNRSFEGPELSDGRDRPRASPRRLCVRLVRAIAQEGDKLDDPSTPWPEDRQMVKLGTLTITGMAADQAGLDKSLLFLPNNVPDGIEPADPMIDVRSSAYPISFGERQ